MKKQFLRVKQIADQTFLRAEKTEVLTEDLVNAEKRVDMIKLSCQALSKKIASCHIDLGSELPAEKRLKKIPQVALASSMQEHGCVFSKDSILGVTLRECSPVQAKLGSELLEYYSEVEKHVLKQINSILENEVHSINKLRKQLGKLTLDMDSARTRYHTAERHNSQAGVNPGAVNAAAKVDVLKDELEEASQKVDQCRDTLAAEMFSLIAKEPQIAQLFVHLNNLQVVYHRNALAVLESSLPLLESQVSNFSQKPVYGCSLEEHLRVTNRTIAQVIETCISFLLECGVNEEGLFRIAGSASKLKKLKSAFDSGIEFDVPEYVRDPHAVAGALKSYLRELPEPLMTYSLYEEWMSAAKMQDFDARLQALWQVVHKLPASNFSNLQYVIKFLSKLHECADVNKMSAQNIAIVMAPNLIWAPIEEANPTFGMNMATANLHSSIVETLISYADWFFPDSEFSFNLKLSMSTSMPSISTSGPQTNVTPNEQDNEQTVNAALLDDASHAVNMQSPKVYPRSVKKPAAPPPPAQRFSVKEKTCNDAPPCATVNLIDMNSDGENTVDLDEDVVLRSSKYSTLPHNSGSKENPEKAVRTSVVRRRSNENITNLERVSSVRQEKPSIPDKPVSYSVHSLDRKSRPPSVSGIASRTAGSTDKLPEVTLRCQVERPTVPPPERPAKPSRFSTVEAFQPEKIKAAEKLENNEDGENIFLVRVSDIKLHGESNAAYESEANNAIKPGNSPTQPSSKLKQNRFDFLVAQTSEKPPERPPRSASSTQDLSELLNIVHDSSKGKEKDAEGQLVTASTAGATERVASDHLQTPVAVPRSSVAETDKLKPPPRPQPPIPLSKPRISSAVENTNL